MNTAGPPLKDFWYLALPARELRPGKTLAKRILDEPILLGRDRAGAVFAVADLCPHRGMPLRFGRFDGTEIACCYHGWRFATDGRCTAIPSLTPEQDFEVGRIRLRRYPCREQQGNVWIYVAADRKAPEPAAGPPLLPGLAADARPGVQLARHFPCSADHAAYGLMDPTHAAFVHTSWWWKRQATRLRLKHKDFEPAPLGWRMKRHALPPENRAYRLLGRNVTTEIVYSLPGIRIEEVRGDRHAAVALTAITPLGAQATEVHQSLYWTLPWLGFAKPLLRRFAARFLEQDREVVVMQQEGLRDDPTLMLIDDADTQAKWYQRLKREWQRAQEEGRAFENPVKPRTLTWHS